MDIQRRFLTTLGMCVTFLIAGCGGGATTTAGPGAPGATSGGAATTGGGGTATQAPGGGATVDACSLLTDEDIKTATGFSPISETAGPTMGIFEVGCEWELDNEGGVPWSIVLGVRPEGGRDYFDRYFAPPVGEGEVLEGVGDEALLSDIGDVNAVKGDTMFSVTYIEFPARNEVAVELAKAVARNLGG